MIAVTPDMHGSMTQATTTLQPPHIIHGRMRKVEETLKEIAHQLTRIADQGEPATLQISGHQALQAWGMRIYQDEFLQALQKLGIEIITD